jgi:diguanylate cyclase (GGDEF)-like protein
MTTHLALLAVEMALCGGILLLLFWMRRRIGLAPLYVTIGAFQYLQVVLASSVVVPAVSGVYVNPGSAILFPLTVFVVLLTYIEQDAEETRKLAYGVVIANLALFAVSSVAGRHLGLADHRNPLGLPVELLAQNGRIIAVGTFALFVDVVATIVVFEQVSRFVTRSLFLRLWLSSLVIMTLDSVVFTTGVFWDHPDLATIRGSLIAGKAVSATVYSVMLAVYAHLVELPGHEREPARGVEDVFQWLTYRQRYEQARSLMARDALTGLYNRGYFDEVAPRQLAHAVRARHPMSLVVADVDRLKVANDQFGHRAGDDLLRFVAGQIRQMVRASDAACRYGGDEFVVVLTSADPESAQVFAGRLLENVRAQSLALRPQPGWAPAAVTIGIASYPADGTTLNDLLQRADERLYDGKRAGGDRVETGAAAVAVS